MISFETQPDRRLLAEALRRTMRWALRLFTACGFILLLPAAVTLFLGDEPVVAVGWLVGAIIIWALPSLLVRSGVRASWKLYGIPIAWQFSAEGVRMDSALMVSLIRWEALESVEPIPGQLLLKVNRQQVIPVPIAGLTPADRDTLAGLLKGRDLLPADAAITV
ncbi:YcxB family protein [Micromonospora avicenniae]|uniref:YcxB-like protein n=1 Tax=Micromonospora avicenniae TaxID=1198245 RepID=A0A1N6YGN6_9ACTN|nr:YcxB family protein [Micromonospora avicenniae]SIR13710.1 YcxB-like protein [Micromonospora avicenniae]